MPRISNYRSRFSTDYKFIDKIVSEALTVGGTDMYYHKLLGTQNPTTGTPDIPVYATQSVTNIQDLLLLENRDRVFDPSIYRMRGHFTIAQLDWNLTQFGLFLDSDNMNIDVHINDTIAILGRKPMIGDVFELPALYDDFAFNNLSFGMPRYYQIIDISNSPTGYSTTWYPHLYRLKCKKLTDTQEFANLLDQPAKDANGDPVPNLTLRDQLSTQAAYLAANNAVIQKAQLDAAASGFETRQFFTLAVDPLTGKPIINTADASEIDIDASSTNLPDASDNEYNAVPQRPGYTGYLVGDGYPPNGYAFGFGIQFPANPQTNDYFLRADFLPNRLFQYNGTTWVVVEDSVRMDLTQTDQRQTLKTSFINNDQTYIYNDAVVSTYINLTQGQSVIQTLVPYQASYATVPYVFMKANGTIQYGFAIADYQGQTLISSYTVNGQALLEITLPTVNGIQQTIPFTGQYSLGLYNNQESQKQSLSQALRPRADF